MTSECHCVPQSTTALVTASRLTPVWKTMLIFVSSYFSSAYVKCQLPIDCIASCLRTQGLYNICVLWLYMAFRVVYLLRLGLYMEKTAELRQLRCARWDRADGMVLHSAERPVRQLKWNSGSAGRPVPQLKWNSGSAGGPVPQLKECLLSCLAQYVVAVLLPNMVIIRL